MLEIGIVILAAGASSRLGEAKQLLRFNGETLLRRSAKIALASNCRPVVVVLGARADIFRKELDGLDVEIAENVEWEKGMSGSINVGLQKMLKVNAQINGALLLVCDQPFLTVQIINRIIEKYVESKTLIVACQYAETFGVPALFDKSLFPQLKNLKAKGGAKKLIEQLRDQTTVVSFPDGVFDVDTPDDFLKLQEMETRQNG
jgi:molybdenum cofactor cytidylyltransferase